MTATGTLGFPGGGVYQSAGSREIRIPVNNFARRTTRNFGRRDQNPVPIKSTNPKLAAAPDCQHAGCYHLRKFERSALLQSHVILTTPPVESSQGCRCLGSVVAVICQPAPGLYTGQLRQFLQN
jgi:hypothetical protein